MFEHDAQAMIERGDALLAAGEERAALAAYDAAVDVNPGDAAALVRAGTLLLDAGEYDAAWRYLEQAALNAPDDAGIHWLLGTTALAVGDGELARLALVNARERGAGSIEVLLDLALASYLALDAEAAWAYAGEVLEARPDHAEALAWRAKIEALDTEHALLTDVARAHCREGRFETAIALLTEALTLGDSYEARLYLGRAYLALGEAGSAIPLLEAAQDLRPEDDEARHSLADARALEAVYAAEAAARPAPAAVPAPSVAAAARRRGPIVPRFCVRCGASMPPEAAFCPDCGARSMGGDA